MRLDKYLCDNLEYSRSEIKKYIKSGEVSIDDVICRDSAVNVNEQNNITFRGKCVKYKQYRYFLLNKPAGFVTATRDTKAPFVMELINEPNKGRLFPVGRLDKDTEGLLLICDDGELAHKLLSPKKHVDKTYYVLADKPLSEKDISLLEKGVDIGDKLPTAPAKADLISDRELRLTITEGRFHQVKRMLRAVDNEVIYLKRISFGRLSLPDDLKIGEYIEVEAKDI